MIITEEQIASAIDGAIAENRVMLFMKGTPDAPACGFSQRTVLALRAAGAEFGAIDILPDPRIRQVLSARSGWPTIPQLFVRGELVGGADIAQELAETGELRKLLEDKLGPEYGEGAEERVVDVLGGTRA